MFPFLIFLTFPFLCVCVLITHFSSDENLIFSFFFVVLSPSIESALPLFHNSEPSAKMLFPPAPFSLSHESLFCETLLRIYFPPSKIPSSPLAISPSSFLPTYFLPRYEVNHSIYFSFSTAPVWGRWLTRCISYFGTLIPTSKNVTCNEISLKIVGERTVLQKLYFFLNSQFLKSLEK